MRSRLVILLLFPGLSLLYAQTQTVEGRQGPKSGTLQELIRITREIYDAGITGNKDVLNHYLDDAFLETDASGKLHDKAWNLQNFLDKGIRLTYDIVEAQVRDYDGTAVLYYKWVVKTEFVDASRKPYETQLRVTDVFVKRNGQWRLVASHRMPLPKDEGSNK